MPEAVIGSAGQQQGLIPVAQSSRIASFGRNERAGTQNDSFGHGYGFILQIRSPEILVRAGCPLPGIKVSLAPKIGTAVHIAGKEPRDIGGGRNRPGQQRASPLGKGGNHVQRPLVVDFVLIEVAQFPQGHTVPVASLGKVPAFGCGRHRAFDDASGRIEMVHDIQGWHLRPHAIEHAHQLEDPARRLEITGTDILQIHDNGIRSDKIVRMETVGMLAGTVQLPFREGNQFLQMPSLGENLPSVASLLHLITGGGAQTHNKSLHERLVQLFRQRRCPK